MDEEKQNEPKEVDPFTDYKETQKHTTEGCKHFYCEDPKQDPKSDLMSVICIYCWHGISIDQELFEVKEGKVCHKK